MLKSMTGFGSAAAENDAAAIQVEIRSVNQRFLEVQVHGDPVLAGFEMKLRRLTAKYIARGKVDLYIHYTDRRENRAAVRVNEGLAAAYHEAVIKLSDKLRLARPDDVMPIATYPGVIETEPLPPDPAVIEPVLMQAAEEALTGLDAMRRQEGENLVADFTKRLTLLEEQTKQAEVMAPAIVARRRERLQAEMEKVLADTAIDENRLTQETAIYADKVNYTEETVRLASHCSQFRQLLTSTEAVGRKLDFLIQEMNREANTLASKANDAAAAQLAVDMKSEIEKLREQVQNIE